MRTMAKIEAYRVDTGEKVRIPAHWIDHPTLGKPFRKTPKQKASERANDSAPEGQKEK